MNKRSKTDALIWIVSAELVGAVSALLSGGFSDFFDKYEEPPLLPPAWLFPVVWTILYALMGYSAYLISSSDASDINKQHCLGIYKLQLAANFFWSILFFRFEALWAAFVLIILLLVLIFSMIRCFSKISPLAAYLNIPYLLWVAFATYLNLSIAGGA
ncbi:MAG: tryptophan-rich sensory protein [Oscillospiraceae bacterium]|nr:tryptophan-rich sensory protein [Oscillospiraceae bacterium]